MEQVDTPRRPKRRDERGASLVEFALVVTLLCTLLLGIIIFGLLLSKRHALTQAAAEGARYAVPVSYTFASPDNAMNAARTKTNQSLESIGGRQCPAGTISNGVAIGTLTGDGIRCTFTVFDCASSPHVQTGGDTYDCIEVKVEVDVNHSPKIVPGSSFIDPFLPDTMTGTSIVSLSGLS
jgi:Flp pilus assembly protein TadG